MTQGRLPAETVLRPAHSLRKIGDIANDPHETRNWIGEPEHKQLTSRIRQELDQRLKESGGLAIPLGFKRNHGSNLRRVNGTNRAEFPATIVHDQSPGVD